MNTRPLIRLENARIELNNRVILRDLNWQLKAGAGAAIMGANGSGKSTFLRCIGGQLWPLPTRSRSYAFGAAPTHTPLLARERIAHLSPEMQDRYVRQSLVGAEGARGWELTAREVVLTGWFDAAFLHQKPDAAQLARADELLEQFDLLALAARSYSTLSQGQLRRVLLARALVKSPQVLLLDEACSGLDAPARGALLQHIEALAQSGQTTLVMATHRADELVPSIREIWEVRDQTLAPAQVAPAQVAPAQVAPAQVAPAQVAPAQVAPAQVAPAQVAPAQVAPAQVAPAQVAPAQVAPAQVAPAQPQRVSRFDFAAPSESLSDAMPLVQLHQVAVTLEGNPVISPFDWRWMPGQHWAMTGANGSGKSTFLRLIRGQIAPVWGGCIERFGFAKRRSLSEIGRDIALLSPQVQARFGDEMPVESAIGSGFVDAFELWRPLADDEKTRVGRIMTQLELDDLRGRVFGRLSYGQTRRVLLARALVTAPKIVLLDEALDGLDAATRERTGELLGELAGRGTHFAFASHHASDFPDWLTGELRFPL